MDLRTALLACTASLILGLACGAFGCRYVYQKDALEAQIASDAARRESEQLKGEVNALQEQAGIAMGAADSHAKAAADAEAKVKALKAKLAKLQAVPPIPAVPDPVGDVVSDPASDLKDQIIAEQDKQITELKSVILEQRSALELQGHALATSERRARGLEIALDAQKHAARSGKWVGRLQGLAIGLCVGYAGGKL